MLVQVVVAQATAMEVKVVVGRQEGRGKSGASACASGQGGVVVG